MSEERIVIRQTIDGVPEGTATLGATATVADSAQAKKAARKEKNTAMRSDPYLWGLYLLLLVTAVVELFSASSSEVVGSNVYAPLIRHSLFLGLGFLIVLWLQKVHYKQFSRWAPLLAVVSLALLLFSSFFGVEINGAQRAIRILGFTIQPAEIVKLTVVMVLARILAKNQEPGGVRTSGVVKAAMIVVVFGGCLWTNGLTNTALLMGTSLAMLLIGGIPMRKIGMVIAVYGVLGTMLYLVKYANGSSSPEADEFNRIGQTEQVESEGSGFGRQETHKGRIARFLAGVHPEDPMDDLNRQVIMSKFAQANGGVVGRGPGNSRESARLPLAFSDYIYSIIIEDIGLVGGVALIVVYLWLLARAGVIAYRCKRAFPAFLIMGCAVLIVFQALAHMWIVTIGPVSGQPLPLISKGGTSVLVMSAAIGMMLSVSRYAAKAGSGNRHEKKEMEELPEDLQAENVAAAR